MTQEAEKWTIIKPKASLLELNLKEIWRYKDLIRMFIKRDFVTMYKQTILGPLWFVIQPIFTSGMYTLIFGKLANISTDGAPQLLFYLAGVINWSYFAGSLTRTSDTFAANSSVFGKVYFPRLTVPVSHIVSGLFQYAIQYALFLVCFFVYLFKGANIAPNWMIVFTPVIILYTALLGMAYGLWISSVTTKYRDLRFALPFIVQLWMYATPVVYPLSLVPDSYKVLMILNPITPAIELFKMAYLGAGSLNLSHLWLSLLFTLIILFSGIIIFNKTEKTFMDTI
jgi:lipopolysaccharide transport system permease protein